MRPFPVLAALLGLGLVSAAFAQQPEQPAQPAPAAPQPVPAPPAPPQPPQPGTAQPAPPQPPQPGTAQPAPPQPKPAPAQPAPAQPKPAPAQPAPAQPGAAQPAQPAPAQPGAAQPAQPAPAQPGAAQPAPAQPAQPGTQPGAAQPSRAPVAKPGKVTSVCPGKILPLAVGNTWTYESVEARDSKGQPVSPPEGMGKLLPLRATKIVVTVTGAETNKDKKETTVKLKETVTYDITKDPKTPKLFEQVVESTIVCSPKGKFDISPESFFFAGEPGGFRGINFSKFERKKETTLKLINNTIGEAEWIEEIAAEYQKEATKGSNAKLGGGKLEMERKFTPQQPEGVATRTATYRSTERIGITTSGRLMLDTKLSPDGKPCTTKKVVEDKPADPKAADPKAAAPKADEEKKVIDVPTDICELPANWIAQIWLADSFGFVQVLNPYAHMYQLVEAKLN